MTRATHAERLRPWGPFAAEGVSLHPIHPARAVSLADHDG
jgi:hypothetical protein